MFYQLTSEVNRSTTKLLRQVTKISSLFTIFTNHAHAFLCAEYSANSVIYQPSFSWLFFFQNLISTKTRQ